MENFWHRKMAARAHEHGAHSILSPSCPHGNFLAGVEENLKKYVKIGVSTPFFGKIASFVFFSFTPHYVTLENTTR
ncbi:MAG: hypothetical protein J5661_05115 [Bacteroidaceae bacterium]|nr:hypothetical protein [Bacteroidaceae bacterium]